MGQYKYSRAFFKIAKMKAALKIVQGGKGCSKTISILQIFIALAMSKRENLIISVVAQSLPNLKSGALRDFEKILKDMQVMDKWKVNKTDKTYTFGSNMVEFFSVDGESSRLGSRRTHLYVNEADGIRRETFVELWSRTSSWTIIDYNPRREFWAHTDFMDEPDVEFIKLNYLDNEFIPKKELDAIMMFKRKYEESGSKYWENQWRVLGLGELGVVDGVIFEEDKDYLVIDKIPEDAEYIGAGLDFGFTHPTTIMKLYKSVDTFGEDHVIIHQSLFKAGMFTPQIAMHIKGDVDLMSSIIVADSARPEMIREMRGMNIPIVAHKKGNVMAGIDLMHSIKIYITASSEESIEEFRSYAYATNRAGENLGVPNKAADVDNSIDAARYGIEYFLSKGRSRTNKLRWISSW